MNDIHAKFMKYVRNSCKKGAPKQNGAPFNAIKELGIRKIQYISVILLPNPQYFSGLPRS